MYAAYTCEDDSFKIAEAHDLSIRMAETMLDAKHLEIPELEAQDIIIHSVRAHRQA